MKFECPTHGEVELTGTGDFCDDDVAVTLYCPKCAAEEAQSERRGDSLKPVKAKPPIRNRLNGTPPVKSTAAFPVHISVDSDDEQSVASCLIRELYELYDVQVVSDKPKFSLSVIHTQRDESHFFSYVAIRYVPPEAFPDSEIVREFYRGEGLVKYHCLLSFYVDIQAACKQIVSAIDVNVFEPERKFRQQIKQQREELAAKQPSPSP